MPAENFSAGSHYVTEAAISGVCCASWESFAHRPRREMPAGAARPGGKCQRALPAPKENASGALPARTA